ncbi:Succinate--hydroxymethylglutarate CoA-transferase [Holothuria leucospilota]|uniref:Succinate--hydroxymethylglutarate CoA-transferase n=1 Tax=Holothuria leucospilota TaxID=206669 RepID=A0A9Q0YT46_HOLLE|nr:Succinate--hydroxymethylglutarate CoA-transferase [Holothuria leucospilota]
MYLDRAVRLAGPLLMTTSRRHFAANLDTRRYFSQGFINEEKALYRTSGPLHGIRILDLTRILAGPFCSMLFGDLGAEVIKIEQPGKGDDTRNWGPPFQGDQSCYFLSINRNKKSVAVNLKTPEGKDLIKKLAAKCDVLIENFVPGKLDKLGLGYETLRHVAPSLIYCSITGFGSDGPYAHRSGYDVVAAAMGGLMHITGPEGGEPCRVGVAMTDLATGLYAKGAILAALYQREKTGIGQRIDCDLLSTQVAILSHIAGNYLMAGLKATRLGTAHSSIVPYQAFKTKDGQFLIIGAGNDKSFKYLCEALNMEHLREDERFMQNKDRVTNRRILIPVLEKRFLEKTLAEWLAVFEGTDVPYGPVQSMDQVFSDPQVLHNNMILEVNHPTAGNVRAPGPAVRYSAISEFNHSPPPQLGQHTTEVLESVLGLSPNQIALLDKVGAISI